MNENKPTDHANGGPNADGIHHRIEQRPYWKRAHHDWKFWLGAILIFGCMVFYVMTVEFSLATRGHAAPALAMPAR